MQRKAFLPFILSTDKVFVMKCCQCGFVHLSSVQVLSNTLHKKDTDILSILILTVLLSFSSWLIHIMASFLDLNNWSRVKAPCDVHKYFQHDWFWVSCLTTQICQHSKHYGPDIYYTVETSLFSSLYKILSINMGLFTSFVQFFSRRYLHKALLKHSLDGKIKMLMTLRVQFKS